MKLWSRDGRELKTLQGHSDAIIGVSFSPNGKTIASASLDGTAKLWRLDSTQLQTIDLDNLLIRSCHLLHDYLNTNSQVTDDRRLCSDFGG